MYWSMVTIATVGYGDIVPETQIEMIFTCVAIVMGTVISSVLIGNVYLLIQQLDHKNIRKQDTMQTLTEYLQFHGVSDQLQEQVTHNTDYFWVRNQGWQTQQVLASLPRQMQVNISFELHGRRISQIDLFSGCNIVFIKYLCSLVTSIVATPRQMIVEEGDIGLDLYIGKCGGGVWWCLLVKYI